MSGNISTPRMDDLCGACCLLYGRRLAGNFPFRTRLEPCSGAADLFLDWNAGRCPMPVEANTSADVRLSPAPGISVVSGAGKMLFSFAGVADFHILTDRIEGYPAGPGRLEVAEVLLLGPVFALWLESRGLPVLHASVVGDGRRAVAFMSAQGGGKSCLAVQMMREGFSLLSDDVLPLETGEGRVYARPSYPQMRCLPADAAWMGADESLLEPVFPGAPKLRVPIGPGGVGRYCGRALELAVLYLPRRLGADELDGRVVIEPLSPATALQELMRGSFLPALAEEIGLHGSRLPRLGEVARRVPMRRLLYPEGLEYLPLAAAAVQADLASLATRA